MMHTAYLSLGSNIDPEKNLYSASVALSRSLTVTRSSSIWESPPYGSMGPNFLNAVVEAQTEREADALKWQVLRELEARLGRVRTDDKFAARTIDLDIVIFDGEVVEPNLWRLAYLAAPCAELLPDLLHPETGVPLRDCAGSLLNIQHTFARYDSFSRLAEFSTFRDP